MIDKIDSLGNELSEGQLEFFKDSKIVNNDNQLYHCYHGTGSSFRHFDQGINWFTISKDYAQQFADFWDSQKGGTIYEVYLNCKNPFDCRDTNGPVWMPFPIKPYRFSPNMKDIFNRLGLSDEEARKFIVEVVNERVSQGYNNDSWEKYEYMLKVHIVTRTDAFRKLVESKGYDSIITIEEGNLCFGVFKPNDVKLTFNLNPTNSANIDENVSNNSAKLNDKVKLNTLDALRKLS